VGWTLPVWVALLFEGMGVSAAVIFYGRFYLQWIVSEIRGHSVVPVAFWYMSCAGSLMLLCYGVYTRSPVGTLSHCFNMVVYSRNLVHIWRGEGALSARRNRLVHAAVALVIVFSLGMTAFTWLHELQVTRTATEPATHRVWYWIAVGVAGQGLFACRFLIQWLATERRRQSVIPAAFWYISVAASLLLLSSHLRRGEWVYVPGLASTVPIYLRNIWFVHTRGPAPPAALSSGTPRETLELDP
jgi:lipid-A-disaccharide synthase-like uncharacterized protein